MDTSSPSTKDGNASNGHQVIGAENNKPTMPTTTTNDAISHELSKSKSAATKKCRLQVDQSILQTSANGLRELFDELNKFVMKAVHTVVANFCKPTNEKEELEFLFLKAEACNCTANLMETLITQSQQEASKNTEMKVDDDTSTFVISAKTYKTFCLGALIQAGLVRLIGNNAAASINQNLITQIDSSLKLEEVLHASSIIKHLLSQHGLTPERIPTISKDLQNLFRILAPSYSSETNYGAIQKIAYTMLFAVFMNIQLLKSYGPRLLATSIIGVAKAFSSSAPDGSELNNLLEALKTVEGQEIQGRFNQEITMDNLKACMQSVEAFWSRVSQPMRMSKSSAVPSASPNPKGIVQRSNSSSALNVSNISNNIMSNIGSEQPSITTPSKPDFVALNTANNNNASQEKIKLQKDNRGLSYPSGASVKQPLHHSQSWPVQSAAAQQPQVTVYKSNVSLNLKWIMTRGRKRTKAASTIPPLEPTNQNSSGQDKEHPVSAPNQNWTNFMEVRTPKAFVRNTNLNPFPSLVISLKDSQKNLNGPPPLEPTSPNPAAPATSTPAPASKVPVSRTSSSSSNLMGSLERTNSGQDFMVIDSDSEPDITEIGNTATPVETNMFDDCICKIQLVRCDNNEFLHSGVEGETIKPISRNLLVNFHKVRLVGNTSFAGKKNSSPIHFKFCFTISNTKDGTKMAEVFSEPFLIVSHTKLLEDGTSQLALIELIPDGAFTANHCPTKICILGSNLTHHHVVTIGNIFAKNLHLVSDEVLIVQFPILPPGRYPVQVHGPGKNPEISNTLTFTLFEPVTNLKLPPLMKPFGQTETVPIPSPSSGSMTANKALKRDRPEASRPLTNSAPIVISSALKTQKVSPARKMSVPPAAPGQPVQQAPQAPVPPPQPAPPQPQQTPQPVQQPTPAPAPSAPQQSSQTPQNAVAQPVWPMFGQSPYPFFVPGMPVPMGMGVPMMMPYQPYPGMQFPPFQAPPGSESGSTSQNQQSAPTGNQLPSIQTAFPMQMAYFPVQEAQQAHAAPADAIAPSAAVPTPSTSSAEAPTPTDDSHSLQPQLTQSSDRLPSIQLPSISQLQTGMPYESQGQVPWFQGSGFIPRPRT